MQIHIRSYSTSIFSLGETYGKLIILLVYNAIRTITRVADSCEVASDPDGGDPDPNPAFKKKKNPDSTIQINRDREPTLLNIRIRLGPYPQISRK